MCQQAYRHPKSASVQIAKIAAATIILSSLLLGSFILAASYVQARAGCHQLDQLDAMLEKELALEARQMQADAYMQVQCPKFNSVHYAIIHRTLVEIETEQSLHYIFNILSASKASKMAYGTCLLNVSHENAKKSANEENTCNYHIQRRCWEYIQNCNRNLYELRNSYPAECMFATRNEIDAVYRFCLKQWTLQKHNRHVSEWMRSFSIVGI